MANVFGVALISILFSAALRSPLAEASLEDYVRAFSLSTAVSGGLAIAAFGCISRIREREGCAE
ncbi:hypothetical protein RE628_13390 [Paenibacillus sp. D2_2]|uniref:hypothetical protein n=1 Tax=Paenibacillus sp. D2_2 TaxID=3073092 RepID=UPI002815A19C|nr:hypothetical protein [Paenibacillus sp. D2_2]WMT43166.1 hypothetical protein RE628_13390 [Paenibacillus sp. D2_2]